MVVCKTESQKFTSSRLSSTCCYPIQGVVQMTSVFLMSILCEKKCTQQVLQWPHHSYSREMLLPPLNMKWGKAHRFSQVIDKNWSKLQCCVSVSLKRRDYCPPCLDSSLLLQGSRVFYWLFWYQCTFPPKFALFSLHLYNHSLAWVLLGPAFWISLIWPLMI